MSCVGGIILSCIYYVKLLNARAFYFKSILRSWFQIFGINKGKILIYNFYYTKVWELFLAYNFVLLQLFDFFFAFWSLKYEDLMLGYLTFKNTDT